MEAFSLELRLRVCDSDINQQLSSFKVFGYGGRSKLVNNTSVSVLFSVNCFEMLRLNVFKAAQIFVDLHGFCNKFTAMS